MARSPRTPLAWRNLTHSPRRLALSLAGVNFAVLLMFMQFGFQSAMLKSTVQILAMLRCDVILLSKAQYAMPAQQRFDRMRITQARGVPGVKHVEPIYLEAFQAFWRLPGQKAYPIRVIAFDPQSGIADLPAVARHARELTEPDTALVDRKSKDLYLTLSEPASPGASEAAEPAPLPPRWRRDDAYYRSLEGLRLTGRSLRLVGAFEMGTDFAYDGNLIMSVDSFARYFPYRGQFDPRSLVDVGAVQLDDPGQAEAVRDRLRAALPDDVLVLTKPDAIAREEQFWKWSTPIGSVFLTGLIIGFVVGVIICYQIIYSDIADHMGEFATLKAMGYGNGYLIRFVLEESVYLSVLAFIPGLLISLVLYYGVGYFTGLLMELTPGLGLLVFLLTLAMCAVSGSLAMRKVLAADPADLF